MNNFYRKTLVVSIVAFLLSALAWSVAPQQLALAQQPTPTQPMRTISVSGNGMVSVRPDIAVVTVGVQTEAAEAGAAFTQNGQQMQGVIDALQASGVISDDIQTQTIQLQPQTPMPAPNQPPPAGQIAGSTETITPTGYIASNLVEVRVRNLANLGSLLDSLTTAGGNRIQGIRFEISDPAAAVDSARQIAWQNARSSAERLAQLAGVTLGPVDQISEFSSPPAASAPVAEMRLADSTTPVSPGTQQVTVNLQVVWALSE